MKQVTIQIGERPKETLVYMLSDLEIKSMLDSINSSFKAKSNLAKHPQKAVDDLEIRLTKGFTEVKDIIEGKANAYTFEEAFADE
jgi:hypothetical protein